MDARRENDERRERKERMEGWKKREKERSKKGKGKDRKENAMIENNWKAGREHEGKELQKKISKETE